MGEITEIDREGKMRTFLTKFTREKMRFSWQFLTFQL